MALRTTVLYGLLRAHTARTYHQTTTGKKQKMITAYVSGSRLGSDGPQAIDRPLMSRLWARWLVRRHYNAPEAIRTAMGRWAFRGRVWICMESSAVEAEWSVGGWETDFVGYRWCSAEFRAMAIT